MPRKRLRGRSALRRKSSREHSDLTSEQEDTAASFSGWAGSSASSSGQVDPPALRQQRLSLLLDRERQAHLPASPQPRVSLKGPLQATPQKGQRSVLPGESPPPKQEAPPGRVGGYIWLGGQEFPLYVFNPGASDAERIHERRVYIEQRVLKGDSYSPLELLTLAEAQAAVRKNPEVHKEDNPWGGKSDLIKLRFVVTQEGFLLLFSNEDQNELCSHSRGNGWTIEGGDNPLLAAGELVFDKDGNIIGASNRTGHFRVPFDTLWKVLLPCLAAHGLTEDQINAIALSEHTPREKGNSRSEEEATPPFDEQESEEVIAAIRTVAESAPRVRVISSLSGEPASRGFDASSRNLAGAFEAMGDSPSGVVPPLPGGDASPKEEARSPFNAKAAFGAVAGCAPGDLSTSVGSGSSEEENTTEGSFEGGLPPVPPSLPESRSSDASSVCRTVFFEDVVENFPPCGPPSARVPLSPDVSGNILDESDVIKCGSKTSLKIPASWGEAPPMPGALTPRKENVVPAADAGLGCGSGTARGDEVSPLKRALSSGGPTVFSLPGRGAVAGSPLLSRQSEPSTPPQEDFVN